jgi:hypothetical protein
MENAVVVTLFMVPDLIRRMALDVSDLDRAELTFQPGLDILAYAARASSLWLSNTGLAGKARFKTTR